MMILLDFVFHIRASAFSYTNNMQIWHFYLVIFVYRTREEDEEK